jgi:hypothetical protein
MKMVKRTLIAIAVVALLATSAQALGPEPHTGGGNSPAIKVNHQKMHVMWPFEYKALDLCVIPVYMNVGYYVQIEKCNERKIKLQQVPCDELVKGGSDWPCYSDCEDIKIRNNFEVKLGCKLENRASVIDKKACFFKGGDVIQPSAGWQKITVCVELWKTKLWNGQSPGAEVKVADLHITVKPNV